MNKWNELSMSDRAAFISVAVKHGLTNMSDIHNLYNEYSDGGYLNNLTTKPFSYTPIPEVRYADGGLLGKLRNLLTRNSKSDEAGTQTEEIDWTGIKTTNNRPYNADNIAYINQKLDTIPEKRRAAIIGDIIEESGGNPFAESSDENFHGLLQWSEERRPKDLPKDEKKAIDKSLTHMVSTLGTTTDKMSWTHGGKGSGYNTGKEAYNLFYNNDATLEQIHHALSWGYVRPTGKQQSYLNRQKVVDQVYKKLTNNKK